MAASDVTIANLALSRLRAGTISSMGENSPAGKFSSIWYDESRKQLLESFDWGFARRTETLAVHGDAAPTTRWAFRYAMPSGCIVARYIQNPVSITADPVPYQIEMNDAGTESTLVTNVEDAVLIYTYDLSTTTLFSPSFVDALSWLLSYNLAWPLTGKGELQDRAERGFNISMRAAAAHDANEQKYEPRRQASWIEARN